MRKKSNFQNSKIIKALHNAENYIIGICLGVILVLTFVNVLLRYVFNTGISWSEEFIGFTMVLMCMVGLAACIRDKSNAVLDNVVAKLSRKGQKWFYVGVNLLVVAMLIYFFVGGIKLVSVAGAQKSYLLRWPMVFIYTLLPAGFVLCLVEQFISIITDIQNDELYFPSADEEDKNQPVHVKE